MRENPTWLNDLSFDWKKKMEALVSEIFTLFTRLFLVNGARDLHMRVIHFGNKCFHERMGQKKWVGAQGRLGIHWGGDVKGY